MVRGIETKEGGNTANHKYNREDEKSNDAMIGFPNLCRQDFSAELRRVK